MSKLVDKVIIVAASAVLAFSAVGRANATSWVITNVLQVSNDGGFGASSFHDAHGNEMSGSNLATVDAATGILGSYNDVTGTLSLTTGATQGSNSFSMTVTSGGGFLFGGSGFLASHNTLDVTFTDDFDMPGSLPSITAGTVTEMGFMLGDVCCSGTDNPNSFTQPGGNADERWITLWGANDFNTATGAYDYGSETTLGMDLRLRLERSTTTTKVPAPAAHVNLGLGLIGMAHMRRRKTV